MIDFLKQAGYDLQNESGIWQRPGYTGIAYSDGDDIETRLRRIVDQASDVSVLSEELRAHCVDWPSRYHLTSLRANLLRPFEAHLRGDILEIGAGCGAITRYLGETGANVLALEGTPRRAGIARSRTRDLANVTVVSDNFENFRFDRQFDVITLIGVLEYANLFVRSDVPARTMLEQVRALLKPGGRLILAIENQLGLKYFAGAPEDHVGISMHGIEGRYSQQTVQTFGRAQLDDLMLSAGFQTREFLSPLPDYKLPVSVVTSHGLSDSGFDAAALGVASVVRDHQLGADTAFELQLAWPTVFKNGLALDLSNSFLICASQSEEPVVDANVLAYHFSMERRPQYCKELVFRRSSADSITIQGRRLCAPTVDQSSHEVVQFRLDEASSYHTGYPLAAEFLDIVNRPGWGIGDVVAFFQKYLDTVRRYRIEKLSVAPEPSGTNALPPECFDLIPQNIIIDGEGRANVFDLEWYASVPLTEDYLLFRAMFVSLGGLHRCAPPAQAELQTWKVLIQRVAEQCGLPISDEQYTQFVAREIEIRREILGGDCGNVSQIVQYQLPLGFPYAEQVARLRQERADAIAGRDSALRERDLIAEQLNLMRGSRSWRITAPLRFAVRTMRHGMSDADKTRIVDALRRRYHRLPLPAPARRAVSWSYRNIALRLMRILRSSVVKGTAFTAPNVAVRQSVGTDPDYIVWGVIDWHFRYQRPQHLASALAAAGRRVFYISPHFVDDDRAGFEVESLGHGDNLFQIKLFVSRAPVIYEGSPSYDVVRQLLQSIGEVLDWADARKLVSLVQHPFWHGVASVLPNSQVVYDCMDLHEGFGNFSSELLTSERVLLESADLTITTSSWLDDIAARHTDRRMIIRNAGEYAHFSARPTETYRDPHGREIIGYYGAIAEWFDVDLLRQVARAFPECHVLLVGADTVSARSKLADLENVEFVGEVPYARLPYYLHAFDVCLLPFAVIPLTLATNPVKVYEYLSAGKPVVSVDLPELRQFGDLVHVARTSSEFIDALKSSMCEVSDDPIRARRQEFAKAQTWGHRVADLIRGVEQSSVSEPLVSVVVVTYNNLELTKACLASLDTYSQYQAVEIIVVDNASSDGSPDYLRSWANGAANRVLILNEDNRGFAAANNQGLACARGEYLVLLNNDTHVTPGWIRTMMRHLQRDKSMGLIGPVTNNIGNEARIDIQYDNMDEMLRLSGRYTRQHIGRLFQLHTAAFFCVMMPRTTYEKVGELDEQFGRGFFEDDDYCRRVDQIGLKVMCAEDVFIHHHLSASFNKLRSADRQALFEQNKAIYEAKWGPWMPHRYRAANEEATAPTEKMQREG